jgi:hypothetical protein
MLPELIDVDTTIGDARHVADLARTPEFARTLKLR